VPLPLRIASGAMALAALLADGTIGRYGRAHWRYLVFVALPVAMLAGAMLAGLVAGLMLGGWAGVALGLAVALGLTLLADRRAHLGHLFADWVFARDLARGARPEITARIDRFAAEIAAARRSAEAEEVVLVGHSLGMVLLAEALGAALAANPDPDPPRASPRLVLVGLGSSLLKIALMPAAARLRAAVARIAAAPGLDWVEFTSRRDFVSFHRADPVAILGLPGKGPRMESIHPRAMLDAAGWRRVRASMLRAHRLYVTGNGRRYFYDWGMIACGPGPAGRHPAPDRLLGPDGAIAPACQETAA
jgi:pimeloyl-ACP methyl ester carboxylesterase